MFGKAFLSALLGLTERARLEEEVIRLGQLTGSWGAQSPVSWQLGWRSWGESLEDAEPKVLRDWTRGEGEEVWEDTQASGLGYLVDYLTIY